MSSALCPIFCLFKKKDDTKIKKLKPTPSISKPIEFVPGMSVVARPAEDWLLAKIIRFDQATKLYEIEDVEFDDTTLQKPHYHVVRDSLIAMTSVQREIPIKTPVLALYAGTSCFYKARVVEQPKKVS